MGMASTRKRGPRKTVTAIRPVEGLIHVIRGQKVMLDADLVALYEVLTKSLNLAVRRNQSKFPVDFMFQLVPEEAKRLRLQFETSKPGRVDAAIRWFGFLLAGSKRSGRPASHRAGREVGNRLRGCAPGSDEIPRRHTDRTPGPAERGGGPVAFVAAPLAGSFTGTEYVIDGGTIPTV